MSTTLVPAAHEMRDRNLQLANRIRMQRSHLKSEMRVGGPSEARHVLADAIETLPDWLETADAWMVVAWAPGVRGWSDGRYQAERPVADQILAGAGVKSRRRMQELSPRQRAAIAAALRKMGDDRKKAAA